MTKTNFGTKGTTSSTPWDVEEKLMVHMISRVQDPVVARVFLDTVQSYPELRLQFLGACMTAEETLQREAVRCAKAHKVSQAAMRAKRIAMSLLGGAWFVCIAVSKLVRKALAHYQQHKGKNAVQRDFASANVVLLPIAYKATGTNN